MTTSPFLTIWTHPRRTVRTILDESPSKHVLWLAALAGLSQQFDRVSNHASPEAMPPLWQLALLTVVIGPLWGLFTLWLGAWLLNVTGSILNGAADSRALRTAIAWAQVPSVTSLLLWIPYLCLFGNAAFVGPTPHWDTQPALALVVLVFGLAQMVLAIWGLVLLCNTVSEAQGYRSAWLGLANFLLSMLVVAVPLIILFFALFAIYRH